MNDCGTSYIKAIGIDSKNSQRFEQKIISTVVKTSSFRFLKIQEIRNIITNVIREFPKYGNRFLGWYIY